MADCCNTGRKGRCGVTGIVSGVLVVAIAIAVLVTVLHGRKSDGSLTRAEKALITGSDSLMHVLTVADSVELAVLRAESVDFTAADLASPEFAALVAKMKYTVQDPSQDGVGIAAPQVGLNRRLIVVCRLDLPGEPFEAYANVQIDSLWGEDLVGREGCLSIPGLRGNVCRKEYAAISYADLSALAADTDCRASALDGSIAVPVRSEVVSGYVARIFQHEVDHLAGILYTDRTGEVWEVEE